MPKMRKKAKKEADKYGLKTLDSDSRLPKGYLSISSIGMYQRCPKQFEFRYVDGIKLPPAVALVEGSTHHAWLEKANLKKIESGEYPVFEEAVADFEDEWTRRQDEIEDWEGDHPDKVADRGRTLVANYLNEGASQVEPIAAEEKFEVDLGGVPVLGFIDVVEKDAILDYKVVGRKKSENDVKNSLQLAVYSKVKKKKTGRFVSLVKKTGLTEVAEAPISAQLKRAADDIAHGVADAIGKGAFPMTTPDSWGCSEKFCGFWKLCRGRRR